MLVIAVVIVQAVTCIASPTQHHNHHHYHHPQQEENVEVIIAQPLPPPLPQLQDGGDYKVYYPDGVKGEEDLPVCSAWSVCNKVDRYGEPRVERQCRCPAEEQEPCGTTLDNNDGHSVVDKTRLYKVCERVNALPTCRYFRDITWTLVTEPDNTTRQVMQCLCPPNSVSYIIKRHAYKTTQGTGVVYSFACSPESRLRCQRKEPCRLFTVKKRPQFEDVNTNTLCRCPLGHTCPAHHHGPGIMPGKAYTDDAMKTYSGYCI